MSLGQLNSLLFTLSVQPVVLPACGIFFFFSKIHQLFGEIRKKPDGHPVGNL